MAAMDLVPLKHERSQSLTDEVIDQISSKVDEFRYTKKNGSKVPLTQEEKKYVLLFLHLYGENSDKIDCYISHLILRWDLNFRYVCDAYRVLLQYFKLDQTGKSVKDHIEFEFSKALDVESRVKMLSLVVKDMVKMSLLYDSHHYLRFALMIILKYELVFVGTYQLTELQWKHVYFKDNDADGTRRYFISTNGKGKQRTERVISEETYTSVMKLKKLVSKSGKQSKLSFLSKGMEDEKMICRTPAFVDSMIKTHFRGMVSAPLRNIFAHQLKCYNCIKKTKKTPGFAPNNVEVMGIIVFEPKVNLRMTCFGKMKTCLPAFQDYCNRNLIFDETQKDPYGNWYRDQNSNYNRCMRAHFDSDED